jgi:hypothetical protein
MKARRAVSKPQRNKIKNMMSRGKDLPQTKAACAIMTNNERAVFWHFSELQY